MANVARERFITKGVKEKIDNILQHIIWKEFVTPAKLKGEEFLEIRLIACPFGNKQMVMLEDDLGKNICDQDCYLVPQRCNEEIIVFFDKENNSETMMLRSESQTAIDWDKAKAAQKEIAEAPTNEEQDNIGSEDVGIEKPVAEESE